MKFIPQRPVNAVSGMSRLEVTIVIFCLIILISILYLGALIWKKGADRAATIMNIRNCQQAMRGHQGMNNLNTGEPFTKRDLETYMKFPSNINTIKGEISFDPGAEKITDMSANPAIDDRHLWLQVKAPNTTGHVGDYGFRDIQDATGW